MEERKNALTLHGKPLTLIGPEITPGRRAPAFKLIDINWQEVSLSDSKGKVRVLSVVHSLDTPICDLQTQMFEKEAARFPGVVIYTISMDLPFAQARYCSAREIKNLKTLSDYREASFGAAYGVLIKELRLLSRAVFIIDADDMIRYAEYVKEVTDQPSYEKALAVLKEIQEECTRD